MRSECSVFAEYAIDKNETKDLDEIMIDVDSMYDEKFYGNTKSDRE